MKLYCNPNVRIEKHGDKTVVIQTFDRKYFDDLKDKVRHNLAGAKIIPHMNGIQIHGRFREPVEVPYDEHSKHGNLTIEGIPIQISSPLNFQALYIRQSEICKIGSVLEKLVCEEKSLLQKFKESLDKGEMQLLGRTYWP